MFKSLKFDNVDSLDYGVHINGEGVYNAPERDVEMISIPGRNGEYALDHGRFANIEVTYPAGIGEMSQADFADKISAFRNALASRKGYCRLEDDYHPDEFRMGVYKSGLEASPVMYNRAGEFDLVFNCKPQRFLKTGEQATEFTQSGTINNPTLFESKPLLELYGYGTLEVNGSTIELHNEPLGNIVLINDLSITMGDGMSQKSFADGLVNTSDPITLDSPRITFIANPGNGYGISNIFKTGAVTTGVTVASERFDIDAMGRAVMAFTFNDISYTAGISANKRYKATASVTMKNKGTGVTSSVTWEAEVRLDYNGDRKITREIHMTVSSSILHPSNGQLVTGSLTADSSVYSIGSPLYFDCEIGEAYKETGGEITLINKNVDIPSDLPTLSPGTNTITMDNTFTKVNVIPRWWII